jgi:AcrR family transcriptional regulator
MSAGGKNRLRPLPRGRHGLPRETVERSQRERLLDAVVRVTADKGYVETTVADVLEEAGVGRESFYELFADKRECTLAAHAILLDDLERQVRTGYIGSAPWAERLRSALGAALAWFAADPVASRFTLIEMASAGPISRERFEEVFQRFVGLLDEGIGEEGPEPDLPLATSLAVSAALARVYEEVAHGRAEKLPGLLPGLIFELLVPYVGEDAANRERERAISDESAPSAAR